MILGELFQSIAMEAGLLKDEPWVFPSRNPEKMLPEIFVMESVGGKEREDGYILRYK